MSKLDAILDAFFSKHSELENNPDNRKELIWGIENVHRSVISIANLENVLEQHKDVFMFKKQLPPVFWPVADQISMLEECSLRLGFRILPSNANIGSVLSLLQRSGVGGNVTLDSVLMACETLGRSGLEHYAPPVAAPPPAPQMPRKIRFDWEHYVTSGEELPLDREIPESVLQRCTLAQVKSLVARRDRALKPWLNQNGFRDQGMRSK